MTFEVIHDFGGRYGSIYFGLEVSASVYIRDDDAEVEAWAVEGVHMPLAAMPDGLHEFMLALGIEEWQAEGGE